MLRTIVDANLPLTRLQLRAGSNSPLMVDLGLEGSQDGMDAHEQMVCRIAAPLTVGIGGSEVWNARQDLFAESALSIVVKCSVPPASTAAMVTETSRLASNTAVPWRAAIQACGIGWLSFGGVPEKAVETVTALRSWAESAGGSLVVLSRCQGANELDVWGDTGDALPLMRALKKQFDPRNTLNPSRFLGGI
jgi:glycolate oxidase FAD binding subunit